MPVNFDIKVLLSAFTEHPSTIHSAHVTLSHKKWSSLISNHARGSQKTESTVGLIF